MMDRFNVRYYDVSKGLFKINNIFYVKQLSSILKLTKLWKKGKKQRPESRRGVVGWLPWAAGPAPMILLLIYTTY
jgi:hypothetical protein